MREPTEKMRSLVRACWTISPLMQQADFGVVAIGQPHRGVTISGPNGRENPGRDLPMPELRRGTDQLTGSARTGPCPTVTPAT